MEAYAKKQPIDEVLNAAIPEGCDLDELQIATLNGLLVGYYCRYQNDPLYESIPELEFKGKLDGSRTFQVAGKMDNLAKTWDGCLTLFEDKTTSESLDSDSDYWLRLRFNSQLLQYVLAARSLGYDVRKIIYDVVRKPAIEPKQIPVLDDQSLKIVNDANGNRVFKKDGSPRESADKEKGYTLLTRVETPEEFGDRLIADTKARPDFYFARREVPILEDDLQEFTAQRLTISWTILQNRKMQKKVSRPELAWARNVSATTCKGCQYQSFCLQNITVNPDQPPAGFAVKPFNQELSQQAA